MTSKTELNLAYGLAIVLIFIGVLCYASVPDKTPGEDGPVLVMLKGSREATVSKVLFDHSTHSESYECIDWHHFHPEEDQDEDSESDNIACGQCHFYPDQARTYPSSCAEDCHDTEELEEAEITNKEDAFHEQCKGCHIEEDVGYTECVECHIY